MKLPKMYRVPTGDGFDMFKSKYTWIIAFVTCMLLVLAACSSLSAKNPSTGPSLTTSAPTHVPTQVIPRWEDMPPTRQFGGFSLNGIEYSAQGSEVEQQSIGMLLGQTTLVGYDIYENDRKYTKAGQIFTLNGISPNCAVAVQLQGLDKFFIYKNVWYTPETLGDLIDDLNLHENLVINQISYSYWKDGKTVNGNFIQMQYTLPDPSVVWEMLLNDRTLINEGDAYYSKAAMGVSVDMLIIGQKNISLAVNEAGYLQTNILDSGKSFFIGKEKVQAFFAYVLAHGNGTEIVSST